MTHSQRKTNRVYVTLVFPLLGLALIPAYQYGRPWVDYHQQNLVIYDFRFNSDFVPIGADEDGTIEKISVQIGQKVRVGDLIAQLNTDRLVIERQKSKTLIKRYESVFAAEKLAIEKSIESLTAKRESIASKIQVAQSESQAIDAELKWIRKEAENIQKLHDRGTASSAELDGILREQDQFKAQKNTSLARQSVVEMELSAVHAQIAEAKAKRRELTTLERDIELARNSLAVIESQIKKCTVTAPCSGTVTRIFRAGGSSLKTGDPIVLIQSDQLWGEAFVEESDLASVQHLAEVQVTTKAFPTTPITGQVEGIIPQVPLEYAQGLQPVNPVLQADRRICIRIKLHPNELQIVPGMTGQVSLKRVQSKERLK